MNLRLVLLNVALWGGVAAVSMTVLDAVRTPPPTPDPAPDAAEAPPSAEMTLQAPPAAVYAALTEHPLFTPSRRPPAPEIAPADAPPPGIALLGVAGVGEARVATLRTGAGETLRVAPGAEVDGWTVARIEPRRVTLRLGGEEHVALLGAPAPDGRAAPPSDGGGPQRPGRPLTSRSSFDLTPPEAAFNYDE